MAKKKKEEVKEVIEEVTQETKVNEPKGDVTKIKQKMTKPAEVVEETITKVDLSNPPEEKQEEEEMEMSNWDK